MKSARRYNLIVLSILACAVLRQSQNPQQHSTSALSPTAGAPCCKIASINPQTGAVVGIVSATGQTFQFSASPAQLRSLRTGQPLYVNLKTNQVSLDGRSV